MAVPVIGALLGALGSAIKGFFSFKGAQADVVKEAVKTLGDTSKSSSERQKAAAAIITAEATSGYWLAAVWRPLMMMVFMFLLLSYWFGYAPPHINDPLSPMMAEIFDLIKIGLGGYIGGRTLEKIASSINLSGVLKELIKKKLL